MNHSGIGKPETEGVGGVLIARVGWDVEEEETVTDGGGCNDDGSATEGLRTGW